ncbi:hypothetical protein D4R49_02350 [bacterium]|nr:MAG: hypothetical protein D4R49_02350 [bacterium]
MPRFESPALEKRTTATLSALKEDVQLLIDGVAIAKALETLDGPLTEQSEVQIELPRVEESFTMSLGAALALVEEVTSNSTKFDGETYHSSTMTLLDVRAQDAITSALVETVDSQGKLALEQVVRVGEEDVIVGLTSMEPRIGLAVVLGDFFYDKYNPPLQPYDVFVAVKHSEKVDGLSAIGVIYAYLFELNVTLGISLAASRRPGPDDLAYPEEDEVTVLQQRATRLRPLLVGPGLSELLQGFQRGVEAADPETAVLHYVKCIEYVSATVIREQQYEDLRKRLLSAESLNPTAQYMDGLLALFEESRQFTKDYEALRLTIERCCDSVLLANHAPGILTTVRTITPASKTTERRQAFSDLAGCLSATRNQVAHAKANYDRTGKECPVDQMSALMICAKVAAEQCIRWYASQNPELRRA